MLHAQHSLVLCGGHEQCRWGISITKASHDHQHVVFELTLPGLPAHCRESKQLMEEDVVLVMFTQSLNTWVSLVFQRDVTMSEYNVSVAMIEKTKQPNPKTAVHLVRLQNQS